MRQAVREVEADGPFPVAGLDSLPPPEIARKAELVGETKAAMPAATVFALAILAGAFIALGAIFSTTVAAGGSDLPYGVARLLRRVAHVRRTHDGRQDSGGGTLICGVGRRRILAYFGERVWHPARGF